MQPLGGNFGRQARVLVLVKQAPQLRNVLLEHRSNLGVRWFRVRRPDGNWSPPACVDVSRARHEPREAPPPKHGHEREARPAKEAGREVGCERLVRLVLSKDVAGQQIHAILHRQTDEAQPRREHRDLARVVGAQLLGNAARLHADRNCHAGRAVGVGHAGSHAATCWSAVGFGEVRSVRVARLTSRGHEVFKSARVDGASSGK
eukprot:7114099-Prymnesium_polylepis.2